MKLDTGQVLSVWFDAMDMLTMWAFKATAYLACEDTSNK